MTTEEVIVEFEKQLHSAVVVLASGFGTHPGENDRIYRKRKEMAEIALSALRAQQEKNVPLTETQIRELKLREWLYVEVIGRCCGKCESAYYQVQPDYSHGEALCCGYPGLGFEFDYCDYGKTWLAYRHKPKEVPEC